MTKRETAEEGRDICGPPLPLLFGAGQVLARWGVYNHPLYHRAAVPSAGSSRDSRCIAESSEAHLTSRVREACACRTCAQGRWGDENAPRRSFRI